MQRPFDLELEKLRKRIIKMGSLVEEQVSKASSALFNINNELIQKVYENEIKVDKIDVKIDKLCQNIFALQQPVASDLRFIIASLEMDKDLERIGDIANTIAKKVENLKKYENLLHQFNFENLVEHTNDMLKNAIDCFINKDRVLANEVLAKGYTVKEESITIYDELLNFMKKNPEIIEPAVDLILISRNYERIADYSRNIAESVIYMIEGKIIKHLKLNSEESVSEFND